MPQAVDSQLLLYADDTCLVFQYKDMKTIEEHLNQDFSTLVDWFVDNTEAATGKACNLIKKEFLSQVFSEHLRTTASDNELSVHFGED